MLKAGWKNWGYVIFVLGLFSEYSFAESRSSGSFNRQFNPLFGPSSFFNGRLRAPQGLNFAPGFSRLVKDQNQNQFQLIPAGNSFRLNFRERINDKNSASRLNLFEQDLFITRDGQIFGGATGRLNPATQAEVAQFLSQNRDAFIKANGRGAAQVVDNLVARQTASILPSNGIFKMDLSSVMPRDGESPDAPFEPGSPEQIDYALKAINSWLNHITPFGPKFRISPGSVQTDPRTGKKFVNLNLLDMVRRGFINQQAINILANSDPTFKCTGMFRPNAMIASSLAEDNYYKVLGIFGLNQDQIEGALGVDGNPLATQGNKIWVPPGHSGVSQNHRVLAQLRSNNPNIVGCYASYDFIRRPAPGAETLGRDPTEVGAAFAHDAEEWICYTRKGYPFYMLFDPKNRQLVRTAPAEIALGGAPHTGPDIQAGTGCMGCHSRFGVIGGGRKMPPLEGQYPDTYNEIPNNPTGLVDRFGRTITSRGFYEPNSEYRKTANDFTNLTMAGRFETGGLGVAKDGFGEPFEQKLVNSYYFEPDIKRMAAELGVNEAFLKTKRPDLAAQSADKNDRKKRREQFDKEFCSIKSSLGGGGAPAGGAAPQGQPRPATPGGAQHRG